MNSIIGIWLFTSLFYQNQVIPLPNPDLQLYMIFDSSATNEMYYYRNDEFGSCRRWAEYKIEDNVLIQKVTKVDPDNMPSCSMDVDMILGSESRVPIEWNETELKLHLTLSEEPIVYQFSKINSSFSLGITTSR